MVIDSRYTPEGVGVLGVQGESNDIDPVSIHLIVTSKTVDLPLNFIFSRFYPPIVSVSQAVSNDI